MYVEKEDHETQGRRAAPATRRRLLILVGVLALGGCASVAPPVPRFVAVYGQKSTYCQIEVVRDTRTTACFVVFKCSRQPVQALAVAPEVCVP